MALTIANTTPQSGDVWGRQKVRIVTVTFDSDYDTPGESFTPAMVGLSSFTYVGVSPDADVLPGYVVQFDYTDNLLRVYGVEQDADAATTDQLDEEDDNTNLSTLVVRILCIGH
jgi:cytochrome oxidase Cu insertion factor (SCO1/SenC/PrrC family)